MFQIISQFHRSFQDKLRNESLNCLLVHLIHPRIIILLSLRVPGLFGSWHAQGRGGEHTARAPFALTVIHLSERDQSL